MNSPLASLRPAEILVVEDNENDVILLREGFKDARLPHRLHHVANGVECLAFLRKEGPYIQVPTQDLVLLDLNMPLMDGREVMAELTADARLKSLPVIVFTTSANEEDIRQMYLLRCSAYVVKPVDFDQFEDVIRQINAFWFMTAVLPSPRKA